MPMVLSLLAMVFGLIGFVGAIWLLVEAFKVSPAEGILTLCVPCYAFYFAFAKLDSPNKNTILGMWLGGGIASIICNMAAAAMTGDAGGAGFGR